VVRRVVGDDGITRHLPRELSDRLNENDGEAGFLYIDTEDPWPADPRDELDRVPDDWVEVTGTGTRRVRSARRDRMPRAIYLTPAGEEGQGELRAHYMRAPFVFCMHCGVSYSPHQRSDFGKLALLGT